MQTVKKVVLAYSGGLDTSVILKWLQDHYHCEVVTFTADIGQDEPLEPVKAKAKAIATGKGTSLPWYFNLFSKRSGIKEVETSSFSPIGKDTESFHQPRQFARIYVR